MGTLLKAILLKTNDPFIMLKCYLEDILKQDGKSWRELLESMQRTNQPKMSNQLFTAIQNLLDSEADMNKLGSPKSLMMGYKDGKQSNDPYLKNIRETNVRALLNAIKRSEIDPTIMKPIISGLQNLIQDIMASQKPKGQKTTSGGSVYSKVKEDKQLKEGIGLLTNLKESLEDAKLDFDGDYIHDSFFERNLSRVMKDKYDIAQLRRIAGTKYAEKTASLPPSDIKKLREKIYNLLNEPIQYNHHKKGRIKEPFIDALLYAYSQNTGVTLADIEQQKEILNARNAIWNHVTQYGRDVLLSIAEEDNPAIRAAIEEREKERPTRQEQATMEEREAEAELTDERMADLLAGKKITIGD